MTDEEFKIKRIKERLSIAPQFRRDDDFQISYEIDIGGDAPAVSSFRCDVMVADFICQAKADIKFLLKLVEQREK